MSSGSVIEKVAEVPLNVTNAVAEPVVGNVKWSSEWKSQAFLWFALVLFLVLFIWAWASYDPDQRIFTLYNVPQNETYDFRRFSGQIIIQDGNEKGVTEWFVGGNEVKLVSCSKGCSDLSDPSSGLITYNSEINGYTWTQSKWSTPTTYTFITNRTSRGS